MTTVLTEAGERPTAVLDARPCPRCKGPADFWISSYWTIGCAQACGEDRTHSETGNTREQALEMWNEWAEEQS